MPEIKIEGQYWSQGAINLCIDTLNKKLTPSDQHLEIISAEVLEEIDILFVGYLLLLKKELTTTYPLFSITLVLHGNVKPYSLPEINDPDYDVKQRPLRMYARPITRNTIRNLTMTLGESSASTKHTPTCKTICRMFSRSFTAIIQTIRPTRSVKPGILPADL